jgi:uncharacterized membrane protein YoaK (UPF0700 family)
VPLRTSTFEIRAPTADSLFSLQLLTAVLSLTAGSLDVITYLGLGGLFAAHITGNLVILAAHFAAGGSAQIAAILSVPVFMLLLGMAKVFAGMLENRGYASLRPLLLLQFLFLAGFLALVESGPVDATSKVGIVGGMLGVSAMAVQNALVQISIKGAPGTAVMTTNITHLILDFGTVLYRADRDAIDQARNRASKTWPSIVGFTVGCGFGAICQFRFGLCSILLPTALSLFAIALSNGEQGRRRRCSRGGWRRDG